MVALSTIDCQVSGWGYHPPSFVQPKAGPSLRAATQRMQELVRREVASPDPHARPGPALRSSLASCVRADDASARSTVTAQDRKSPLDQGCHFSWHESKIRRSTRPAPSVGKASRGSLRSRTPWQRPEAASSVLHRSRVRRTTD